jgi:NitT/TauT family transport system substrate-binding protein
MRPRTPRGLLVLPLGALVLLTACATGGGTPPAAPAGAATSAGSAPTTGAVAAATARLLQKMTVPYTPISGPMAPLWIAVEQKLFEKYGLEVTPQFIGGSSPITQAMSTGEFDIGIGNGAVAALNRLNGGDILIIGLHAPAFSIDSWSRPEIRTIADLRGKTIGVTRFGSSTHFAAIAMLASVGMQPSDAVVVQTGGVGESLAALLSLQIDDVMLAPPQSFEAGRAGFHQVAVLSQLGEYGLFPETGIIAREAVLREPARHDAAVRFLRAFAEALTLARTDPELSKQAYRKYTQVDDEQVLQETYDYYSKFFSSTLRIDEKSITNLMLFLDHPQAREADPHLFYDNTLVDEAAR